MSSKPRLTLSEDTKIISSLHVQISRLWFWGAGPLKTIGRGAFARYDATVHVFHERLWRISWDYDACVVRVSNIITSARGVRGGIFAPRHTGKDRETTAKGIHPREPERRRGEEKRREDVSITLFKFAWLREALTKIMQTILSLMNLRRTLQSIIPIPPSLFSLMWRVSREAGWNEVTHYMPEK